MIGFESISYLSLLCALVLPLVIHLWNKRKPKPILFPSIRFIDPEKQKQWRRLRFSEPLLFFLRVLTICFLVFLLLNPFYSYFQDRTERRVHKLFISSDLLPIDQYPPITQFIDGLPQRDSLQLFCLTNNGILQADTNKLFYKAAEPLNYAGRKLQHIAAKHNDKNQELHCFLSDRLAQFNGAQLDFPKYLNVHLLPQLMQNEEKIEQNKSLNIGLFHASGLEMDARYVIAALKALKYSGRPLSWEKKLIGNASDNFEAFDFVFYLSDASTEVPYDRLQNVNHLMYDPKLFTARFERESNIMVADKALSMPIPTFHSSADNIDPIENDQEVVWCTAHEQALLSRIKNSSGYAYEMHTRFNEQSNDWVLQGEFPLWIEEIYNQQFANPLKGEDRRRIRQDKRRDSSKDQAEEEKSFTVGQEKNNIYAYPYLWYLIVLLFLIERIWVVRKTV